MIIGIFVMKEMFELVMLGGFWVLNMNYYCVDEMGFIGMEVEFGVWVVNWIEEMIFFEGLEIVVVVFFELV